MIFLFCKKLACSLYFKLSYKINIFFSKKSVGLPMPLIIRFYCFSIVNSYTISNKVHQMKRFTALSYGIQELLKAMLTVGMCHIIRIAFAKAIFEFTLSSKNSKSIKFLKTLYCNKRLLLLIFLNLLQKKKHL